MKLFKVHNIFPKLLSLLIAVLLWSYVVLEIDPIKTRTFTKPVEMIGVEQLEERGLVLISTEQPSLSIKTSGKTSQIVRLSSSDIRVTVDFSKMHKAGVYYPPPTIEIPGSVEVKSYQPRTLPFTIENIVTRKVAVRVTTRNGLRADRLVDKLTPEEGTVAISGAESVVASVKYALLTVDLQNISKDGSQNCRVSLYTEEDALVESPFVAPLTETMDVAVSLSYVAEVPLEVTLLPTAALTADMVEAHIVPEKIRVYGSKSAIDQLTTLSLGTINLEDVPGDGQEVTLIPKLPADIKPMTGEPESIRVKLSMKTDAARTLRVTEIALKDEKGQAAVLKAKLTSGAIDVEVRGKAGVITALTAADLTAEAVFDSAALGAGVHMVPVRITVQKSGVTAVSDNLTAQITITEEQEDEGS